MKFITKNWYLNILVGLLFVASSFYTIYDPLISYASAAVLFSILFLVSGITQVSFGISNLGKHQSGIWDIFVGSITSLLGIFLMSNIGFSMETLVYFIGFFAIYKGLEQVIIAMTTKFKGYGWIVSSGIINILFGMMILFNPFLGTMTVVFLISLGLLSTGCMEILIGIQLKKRQNLEEHLKVA